MSRGATNDVVIRTDWTLLRSTCCSDSTPWSPADRCRFDYNAPPPGTSPSLRAWASCERSVRRSWTCRRENSRPRPECFRAGPPSGREDREAVRCRDAGGDASTSFRRTSAPRPPPADLPGSSRHSGTQTDHLYVSKQALEHFTGRLSMLASSLKLPKHSPLNLLIPVIILILPACFTGTSRIEPYDPPQPICCLSRDVTCHLELVVSFPYSCSYHLE